MTTYKIYCIEDINDIRYVGSTKQLLTTRLSQHRTDEILGRNTSSKQLNLYNCIIYLLEEVDAEHRYERETYHMKRLNTVNIRVGQTLDRRVYNNMKGKEYYKKNREKCCEASLKRYYEQREKKLLYGKEYYKNNKEKWKK